MELISQLHESIGILFARVFLGLLFFFQGYDAVFNVKIKNVINNYESAFENKGIPKIMTITGAWFTSLAELIGGFLLIVGLFRYYALYLLGVDLLIASVAFGIATPMWDTRHVFPRIVILTILLLVPAEIDILNLDSFF